MNSKNCQIYPTQSAIVRNSLPMSGSLIPITQHLDDMNINRRKSAADSLNKSSLSVDISKLNDSRLERKRRKLSLNIKEFNRPGFTSNLLSSPTSTPSCPSFFKRSSLQRSPTIDLNSTTFFPVMMRKTFEVQKILIPKKEEITPDKSEFTISEVESNICASPLMPRHSGTYQIIVTDGEMDSVSCNIPIKIDKPAVTPPREIIDVSQGEITKRDENSEREMFFQAHGVSRIPDASTQSQTTQQTSTDIFRGKHSHQRELERILTHTHKRGTLREDYRHIKYFIFFPDDIMKSIWDVLLTLILFFLAFVTPYRAAFIEDEDKSWLILETIIDCLFVLDIFLNFFSSYFDDNDNLIINRQQIAIHYLKTWFIVDLIALLPLILFITFSGNENYTSMARLAKLPRLYRLFKITKLLKMMKEKNKLVRYFNEMLKLSTSIERLFYFIFCFILLCHFTACLWYFVARMDSLNPETWVIKGSYQDLPKIQIYVAALYWTVTTITTVGYGDISAGTNNERIVAIIVMWTGVCTYSFAVGSLSSVLNTLDTKDAKLKKKLGVLEELRSQYELSHEIYSQLKKALKYDHSRDSTEKINFVNELPLTLKNELSVIMHKHLIRNIPFFSGKPPHFLAFAGPLLKSIKVSKGEYIYREEDPSTEVFFIVSGRAALVLQEYRNLPFVYMEKGDSFGEGELIALESVQTGVTTKRVFTARAMDDCELIILSKMDLFEMDDAYPEIVADLFKNAGIRHERIIRIKEEAIRFVNKYIPNEKYECKNSKFFSKRTSTEINVGGTLELEKPQTLSLTRQGTLLVRDKNSNLAFRSTLKDIDEGDEFIETDEEMISSEEDNKRSKFSKYQHYETSTSSSSEFTSESEYSSNSSWDARNNRSRQSKDSVSKVQQTKNIKVTKRCNLGDVSPTPDSTIGNKRRCSQFHVVKQQYLNRERKSMMAFNPKSMLRRPSDMDFPVLHKMGSNKGKMKDLHNKLTGVEDSIHRLYTLVEHKINNARKISGESIISNYKTRRSKLFRQLSDSNLKYLEPDKHTLKIHERRLSHIPISLNIKGKGKGNIITASFDSPNLVNSPHKVKGGFPTWDTNSPDLGIDKQDLGIDKRKSSKNNKLRRGSKGHKTHKGKTPKRENVRSSLNKILPNITILGSPTAAATNQNLVFNFGGNDIEKAESRMSNHK